MKKILFFVLLIIPFLSNAQNNLLNNNDSIVENTISKLNLYAVIYVKSHDAIIVKKDNKSGILDIYGNFILEPIKCIEITEFKKFSSYFLIIEETQAFMFNKLTKLKTKIEAPQEFIYDLSNMKNIDSNTIIKIEKNNKIGLIMFPEKEIIQPIYDFIYPMAHYENLFLLIKENKHIFYDSKNNIFSKEFEVPKNFDFKIDNSMSYIAQNDFFPIKIDNTWYFQRINKEQFPIVKFNQVNYNLDVFDDAVYIPIKLENHYGFVDIKGNQVINCMYEDVNWFRNDITIAKYEGKYGTIDMNNKIIIPFIYDSLAFNKKSMEIKAFRNNKSLLLYEWGESVSPIYVSSNKKSKYGFTIKNKAYIDYVYDMAEDFENGFAKVNIGFVEENDNTNYKPGFWGVINYFGELIIPCKYNQIAQITENLIWVKLNDKWAFYNAKGELISQFIYDDIKSFANNFAAVKLDNKWGFIDNKGFLKIKNIYDNILHTYSWGALVCLNGKWGIINYSGEFIVPNIYDNIGVFKDEKAKVEKDGKSFFINRKGEIVE